MESATRPLMALTIYQGSVLRLSSARAWPHCPSNDRSMRACNRGRGFIYSRDANPQRGEPGEGRG